MKDKSIVKLIERLLVATIIEDREMIGKLKKEMECMEKIEWRPDFSYDPEDLCSVSGGGHAWVEVTDDSVAQVLECFLCGKQSIGYHVE